MARMIDVGFLAVLLSSSQLSAAESIAVEALRRELPFVTSVSDRGLLQDFIENNLDAVSDDTLAVLAKIASKTPDNVQRLTSILKATGRTFPPRLIKNIEFVPISSDELAKAKSASANIAGRAQFIMNAYESRK